MFLKYYLAVIYIPPMIRKATRFFISRNPKSAAIIVDKHSLSWYLYYCFKLLTDSLYLLQPMLTDMGLAFQSNAIVEYQSFMQNELNVHVYLLNTILLILFSVLTEIGFFLSQKKLNAAI